MNLYLARVACLGQWTLNNLSIKNKVVHNQQKTRVDLFLDVESGRLGRTKADIALKYITRSDISESIFSQETMLWLNEQDPKAIIMDSFAELTDQRFNHKIENWAFCSNYSDINHSAAFSAIFDKMGLLRIDVLYDKYNEFFKSLCIINNFSNTMTIDIFAHTQ